MPLPVFVSVVNQVQRVFVSVLRHACVFISVFSQCSRCLTVCLTLCCLRLFVIAVLSQVQQVFVSVLIHACVFVSVYSEVHQVSVSIFDSVLTHVCLSVCSASAADVHQCVQPYMAGACQCVC